MAMGERAQRDRSLPDAGMCRVRIGSRGGRFGSFSRRVAGMRCGGVSGIKTPRPLAGKGPGCLATAGSTLGSVAAVTADYGSCGRLIPNSIQVSCNSARRARRGSCAGAVIGVSRSGGRSGSPRFFSSVTRAGAGVAEGPCKGMSRCAFGALAALQDSGKRLLETDPFRGR